MIAAVVVLAAAFSTPGEKATAPLASPEQVEAHLGSVRRIYIEKLGGGESAAQIRDMLIGALQQTKVFVVTENSDRADAMLRGSAEDLIYTDQFQSSDGINARAGMSGGSRAGGGNLSIGQQESVRIVERKHEASASVRLVNRDGDVIWSATEESQGAKFRGASADIAEKVVKRLLSDYDRIRKASRP